MKKSSLRIVPADPAQRMLSEDGKSVRLGANVEVVGDLLVVTAGHHQAEHLALTGVRVSSARVCVVVAFWF